MPTSIFDLVKSGNITAYWETMQQDREPYFLQKLFPPDKKLGLDLSYIKGSAGLPVVLKTSAFDVKAVPRNRIGFSKMTAEMPFFKESMLIDEKTRQQLNLVLQSGNQSYIDSIMNHVFNDTVTLLDAAAAARERMRAMALTTGTVLLADNGQEYSYDYGVPANHKYTEANFNDPNFDVIYYLNNCADTVEDDTGTRPTNGILSRNQLHVLMNNTMIRKSIYVMTNGVGGINTNNLISYIRDQTGITLNVYNKRYRDSDGSTQLYIPDNVISLYPDGVIGRTIHGTTPEESDLMSGSTASISITDTGVAVTTMKQVDPVNVETKVTMICLPSFEAADQIAIIDTTPASNDDDDESDDESKGENGGTS